VGEALEICRVGARARLPSFSGFKVGRASLCNFLPIPPSLKGE